MALLYEMEKTIKNMVNECGYDIDSVDLVNSSRRDLGEFQINIAMKLAKSYKKNPMIIANEIVEKLKKSIYFTNINIAKPGFINLSVNDQVLISFANEILSDFKNIIEFREKKKIFLDYGGANIAKALHVGHLRTADIGEALKRLAVLLGNDVISDVHFGDIGRQSGMVISEVRERMPELVYFDETYAGEYPKECPIKAKELEEIYPEANKKAKSDENKMEEARNITAELEKGENRGYVELWSQIKKLSISEIKKIYTRINTTFDLWEGEGDSLKYIPNMISYMKQNGSLEESEGALVVNVEEEDEDFKIPPLIVVKSNGATLYATRELATLYSRINRFNPDEVWYVVDNRQELYFKQVIRAAYKSEIVPKDKKLEFVGFGTMNGKDGKPFKTRDGGVMTLVSLLDQVKDKSIERLSAKVTNKRECEEIAETIAISALKYADLLPNRSTDYIFDIEKFDSLEGKTGPYLLYCVVRIKSLLNKVCIKPLVKKYNITYISNESVREVILKLISLPRVLNNSFDTRTVNEIAEYLYNLANIYNKFYAENNILNESNIEIRESWIALSKLVCDVMENLLYVLGMNVPSRM